jgi:hypothetical protein
VTAERSRSVFSELDSLARFKSRMDADENVQAVMQE